ncbi:MAG: hypothetical protein CTY12_01975 [Methylotenera sp.]|nr:MAG: hypothetical protein CTY12_01975 [Methylotenera sp.]
MERRTYQELFENLLGTRSTEWEPCENLHSLRELNENPTRTYFNIGGFLPQKSTLSALTGASRVKLLGFKGVERLNFTGGKGVKQLKIKASGT